MRRRLQTSRRALQRTSASTRRKAPRPPLTFLPPIPHAPYSPSAQATGRHGCPGPRPRMKCGDCSERRGRGAAITADTAPTVPRGRLDGACCLRPCFGVRSYEDGLANGGKPVPDAVKDAAKDAEKDRHLKDRHEEAKFAPSRSAPATRTAIIQTKSETNPGLHCLCPACALPLPCVP